MKYLNIICYAVVIICLLIQLIYATRYRPPTTISDPTVFILENNTKDIDFDTAIYEGCSNRTDGIYFGANDDYTLKAMPLSEAIKYKYAQSEEKR